MNYENSKAVATFLILTSDFILSKHRVSPGECGFAPSDGRPRDQRRNFKNSLRSVE